MGGRHRVRDFRNGGFRNGRLLFEHFVDEFIFLLFDLLVAIAITVRPWAVDVAIAIAVRPWAVDVAIAFTVRPWAADVAIAIAPGTWHCKNPFCKSSARAHR